MTQPSTPAPFIVRLNAEIVELESKVIKLDQFIHCNPGFQTQSKKLQGLMFKQLKTMRTYLQILNERKHLHERAARKEKPCL